MSDKLRADILGLIGETEASDRGIVESVKEEMKQALECGITIAELYKAACNNGFKGSRSLFTRILVEKGLYSMKSKPRKRDAGSVAQA